MTTEGRVTDYRIFVLGSGASSYGAKPEDIQKIAEILDNQGGVHVVYPLRVGSAEEGYQRKEIERSVDMLV